MLIGRTDEVAAIVSHIRAARSTYVSGPRGVGLSAVLEACAAKFDVPLVRGADSVPGTPFVPFAPTLAAAGLVEAGAGRIYREFAVPGAGPLVVDDMEKLDLASQTLVAQVARQGGLVVLGCRSSESLPPSLVSLARAWPAVELQPLGETALLELARSVVGHQLSAPLAVSLVSRSRGLPAVASTLARETTWARDTVRSALRAGGQSIDGMDESAWQALVTLVLADGMPAGIRDRAPYDELLGRGVAVVAQDKLVAAGGLAVDAVFTHADRHRWRLRTVDHDEFNGPASLRAKVLRGAADDRDQLVAVGTWLLRSGRSTEILGLLGTTPTGRADEDLLRAEALAALGHRPEALEILDVLAAASEEPEVLLRVARAWLEVLRDGMADQQELARRIRSVRHRLPEGQSRREVLAGLLRREVLLGERAASGGETLPADDATSSALRLVMGGELHAAATLADAADGGDESGFEHHMGMLARFLPLVYDGQLAAASDLADSQYRAAAAADDPGAGLWGYNRAKIALHAGRLHDALALSVLACQHLEWRDSTGLLVPARALQVASLARLGRLAEAESLARTFGAEDEALPRVRIGLARMGAERRRWAGDRPGAADLMLVAARHALDDGEVYSGLLALDEAFMLHPRADLLERLSGHAGRSHLLDLCVSRARAVLSGDALRLEEVGEELATLPIAGRAAHALALAAELAADAGREIHARRLRRRRDELTRLWHLTGWPTREPDPMRLTMREWEIAMRAASRERSREIGAALGLSPRTVDNHLAAVFRKLGVNRREDLRGRLDVSVAPIGVPVELLEL